MKELTIEQKAKLYDEVVNKLKGFMAQGVDPLITRADVQDFFPELKESEDEKIRKTLIALVKCNERSGYKLLNNVPTSSMLAWLEKQGEQKPVEDVNGEDYGIDSLWHAHRILEKTLGKVDGYQTDDGILEHECAISAVKKLYEQKPAWSEYDCMMIESIIQTLEITGDKGANRMKIDFLKSLKDRVQPQPKQEWSEEDEKMIEAGMQLAHEYGRHGLWSWLKDLKDRVQPKTTWKPSKEQIMALRWVLNNVPYNKHKEEISGLIEQIKDFV